MTVASLLSHLMLLALSSAPLEPTSETVRARSADRCGGHSVRGIYAAVYHGTAFQASPTGPVAVPTVYLGRFAVDPATQSVEGSGTVSLGGNIVSVDILDGHVQVFPDCTAEVSYRLWREGDPGPAPTPVVERWIVLEQGKRIQAMIVEFPFAQHATLGSFERLTPSLKNISW